MTEDLYDKTTTDSEDAQFLIQATFGPTTESLEEISRLDYKSWIQEQVDLPPSTHRTWFRSRINPHYSLKTSAFPQRNAGEKGSRYQQYALNKYDKGKTVFAKRGKLKVDRKWRSDLSGANGLPSPTECKDILPPGWKNCGRGWDLKFNCRNTEWIANGICQNACWEGGFADGNYDCSSGWAAQNGEVGVVCSVDDRVGGYVTLSADPKCDNKIRMLNPAIAVDSDVLFQEVQMDALDTPDDLQGVVFLSQDMDALSGDGKDLPLLKSNGNFFMYDPRMAFVENTDENPSPVVLTSGTGKGGEQACLPKTFLNEKGCVVQPKGSVCALLCGSKGEVANQPTKGNRFAIATIGRLEGDGLGVEWYADHRLDRVEPWDNRLQEGKDIVWLMQAFSAKDQLRQRVAFALHQILVTGCGPSRETEPWVNYYDIFVRNSFGNFYDVLREVTYSPIMGEYLTYSGSESFDASGSYPDENYAREVMQLFTIGLYQLNMDGTEVRDEAGNKIDTYDNEDIMNFARVFTGFRMRASRKNLEASKGSHSSNPYDPMQMSGGKHDRHPKPDLYDGFLGDGYPLCGDLASDAFLSKGAKYEFAGYEADEAAIELPEGSQLFRALSDLKPTVVLESSLTCSGLECEVKSLSAVKVGEAYYEFVPPDCVYMYFYNGRLANTGNWFSNKNRMKGEQKCLDPSLPLAAPMCCKVGAAVCTDTPHHRSKKSCTEDTRMQSARYCKNTKWCDFTCWQNTRNDPIYKGPADCSGGVYEEKHFCDSAHQRATYAASEAQCQSEGLTVCPNLPSDKCGMGASILRWSSNTCSSKVVVHQDGRVSSSDAKGFPDSFEVSWSDEVPEEGEYDIEVEVEPVFSTVPTTDQVKELTVGAYLPRFSCTSNCDSAVKVYAKTAGNIDDETVFEVDGRFVKNVKIVVKIVAAGKTYSFRNPPAFTHRSSTGPRGALAEVESFLQHIFHHPNTPVAIAKKLIQRFVTSNPGPDYVTAVAGAFKTGSYEALGSGKYGDLLATISAILLHDEARKPDDAADGLLREPMLKMLHLMRAFEYKSSTTLIETRGLQDHLGQFPHQSPTVFNFYTADFTPLNWEPLEGEAAPRQGLLVAPEFEIFTPPLFFRFISGMASFVQDEGFSFCQQGLGVQGAYGNTARKCAMGEFGFSDTGMVGSIDQLNLLLTGGRMTTSSRTVVEKAYNDAEDGMKLKAAQKAMLLLPEFNNLGNPIPDGTQEIQTTVDVPHTPASYKALVLLFMEGGADTYQMLVPKDNKLYGEYKDRRGGLALAPNDLIDIETTGQKSRKFGVHQSFQFLASLYNSGQAAFVANIGNLMEPLSAEILKNGGRICPNVFSHSHAQMVSQTMKCQDPTAAPRGVAGRIADQLLQEKHMKVTSFSVAGPKAWSSGFIKKVDIVGRLSGFPTLGDFEKEIADNVTHQKYGNVYFQEYVQSLKESIDISVDISQFLAKDNLIQTKYATDSKLSQQLHQVARLIATHEDRKAERDFFIVAMGGWDHHHGIIEGLNENFATVDSALEGFVKELKEQGKTSADDELGNFAYTTLLSQSEFARTLSFNGQGTDHGWGGNHFILGGDIEGGVIYNDFLETYVEGNQMEHKRGRVIPKYSWESVMVPISQWMGVDTPGTIFPNLGNFNSTDFIKSTDLFKSLA